MQGVMRRDAALRSEGCGLRPACRFTVEWQGGGGWKFPGSGASRAFGGLLRSRVPLRGWSPFGAGPADGQGHGPKRGVCAMSFLHQIRQALRRQVAQNESWSWPKMRKRVPQCKRQKTTSLPNGIAIQMATDTQCSSKVTFDENLNQRPLPLKAWMSTPTAMSTDQ